MIDQASILIIGAKGQLGTALRQKYPSAKTVDVNQLDISDRNSVERYDWSGIKTIINAAAYTSVDEAETSDGRIAAWKVNAEAVANLVAVCAQKDITLVHISSEYVFDGATSPHKEAEAFSPLSVYGSSKAAGDLAVSLLPKFYILRISWLIGEGKNFVRTMMGLAEKNISPSVVNDQIGRLTFTEELTKAIDHLLTKESAFGTYNLTNDGDSVSWANIAEEVFHIMERGDLKVTGVSTNEYFKDKAVFAARPLRSTLDLAKIKSTGFKPNDWHSELRKYIKKEKN